MVRKVADQQQQKVRRKGESSRQYYLRDREEEKASTWKGKVIEMKIKMKRI